MLNLKTLSLAIVAGLSFTSASAFAHNHDADTRDYFDHVEYNYFSPSDDGFDMQGFDVTKSFSKSIYARAELVAYDSDFGGDLVEYFAGVGYKHDFNSQFTGFADLSYAGNDVDGQDDGFLVRAGSVYRLSPSIEFDGAIRYVDAGEDDQTQYEVNARWYFAKGLSLSIGYIDAFSSDDFGGAARAGFAYHW